MPRKGVLYGIGAYLIWGVIPVYFKAISAVPPLQIMFHRVAWSFLLLAGLILLRRQWAPFRQAVASPKILAIYSLASVLLGANWLTYIWAVNSGHVVDASLGYFINPLVSVAMGVVLLRERLRQWQWLPVGLAAVGVLYLTVQSGSLPWIALALAFTFGSYGLLKKTAPLGSFYGLTLETALLFLPALGYLLFAEIQGRGALGNVSSTVLLLPLAGVITSVPLLLFGSAARSIPLSLVGLLHFIAPTCQFLLGVLLYHEPFDRVRLVGFSFIWIALAIYSLEGFLAKRKTSAGAPTEVSTA